MNSQPLKFFIYCRKSSEDEDRQILSIDAQLSELRSIADRDGLTIVGTFTESKTAKGPGREVFNEVLRRIERGEASGILTWKLDRLARNFDDGGRIIGLLQRAVIQEIRTFEKSYLPSDNVLMIAVEFGMANQYVRDLSMNIRRGIREKIRRGIYSSKAPIGYLNDPRSRTIEPHPEYFPKMKTCLEHFAGGLCSLTTLQKEMASVGILGSLSKKPLPLSSIGNLLHNPFYYGVFLHKGEMHQGIHAPMISKETFDKIQVAFRRVGKPRKKRGEKGFLFLNFATCATCGHCITAERHTKKSGIRYHYYRCTHKNKKPHPDDVSLVREESLAEEIKRQVSLVTIPDEWKEKFLAQIELWQNEEGQERQERVDRIKAQLATLKSKIDRLNTAFTEGAMEIQEFKELKNPLIGRKAALDQELIKAERGEASPIEPLKTFICEANQAEKWVSDENWVEMKSFLQKVGLNRLLRAQTLTVSFAKPFNSLAETNLAVREIQSVSEQCSRWWRRRELNPRP